MMSVLFAKEVKKGHPLSDLFKHWKKVQLWISTLKERAFQHGQQYKHWKMNDFIDFASLSE